MWTSQEVYDCIVLVQFIAIMSKIVQFWFYNTVRIALIKIYYHLLAHHANVSGYASRKGAPLGKVAIH